MRAAVALRIAGGPDRVAGAQDIAAGGRAVHSGERRRGKPGPAAGKVENGLPGSEERPAGPEGGIVITQLAAGAPEAKRVLAEPRGADGVPERQADGDGGGAERAATGPAAPEGQEQISKEILIVLLYLMANGVTT